MNNIKATFADTRGHARRGSQKPPRPSRATDHADMLRKQDPASDTSDSLPHLYTRRKRLQRQPSDDGRAHLARTIRQRMLCPICFVKNPELKHRVFARRTKKRP